MQGVIRTPEDLGAAVRAIRVENNLSQDLLASHLQVSQRYLSELERGKPKIFDARLLSVLNGLGLTMTYETRD